MFKIQSIFAALIIAVQVGGVPSVMADSKQSEIPSEVRSLEGTYTGSWTMFGIDRKGDVIKNMAWTDTIEARDPRVEANRAFVSTTNVMVFEGGHVPPFKMQGKEGYALKPDGSLGNYFIEINGQTHQMARVGENVWSYTAAARSNELNRLGFPANASGQHVLVKVVTSEQGAETHRISRLTMVSWKDKQGKEQVTSFVSLKGYHVRQP